MPNKKPTGGVAKLQRAAMALRAKFVEEFGFKRDSSAHYFYDQMKTDPKILRVMWIHDYSLSYRNMPACDEDDFYSTRILRDELSHHLKLCWQELPALMGWFVENLLKMRRDIVWVERETKKLCPMLEKEYLIWTQIACYGTPGGTGLAGTRLVEWLAHTPSNQVSFSFDARWTS